MAKPRVDRSAPIDPTTGEKLYKEIPEDLDRRYDEAVSTMLETREKYGIKGPRKLPLKEIANGQDSCFDSLPWGYILGFTYGLQYDWKTKGQCYNGIEDFNLAIDVLADLLPSLLIPTEAAKVIL